MQSNALFLSNQYAIHSHSEKHSFVLKFLFHGQSPTLQDFAANSLLTRN